MLEHFGHAVEGRGNVANIVCPVHKWTYDLDGRLMGAPEFERNPDTGLIDTPLQNWHGLLFEGWDVPRSLEFLLAIRVGHELAALRYAS